MDCVTFIHRNLGIKSYRLINTPTHVLLKSNRFDLIYYKMLKDTTFTFSSSYFRDFIRKNNDVKLLELVYQRFPHYFINSDNHKITDNQKNRLGNNNNNNSKETAKTSYSLIDDVVQSGSIANLLFLLSNLPPSQTHCTTDAMDRAALGGHISILSYLFENRTEGCSNNILEPACYKGGTKVVRYLLETMKVPCPSHLAVMNAVRSGNLETIRVVLEHFKPSVSNQYLKTLIHLDPAIDHGNLEIIKMLLMRFPFIEKLGSSMVRAAEHGFMEIVIYLHENGWPSSSAAIDFAAGNGHLDVVKYLFTNRTEGCTIVAVNKSAGNGHLDVIRYLVEEKHREVTEESVTNAAINGHYETLRYMAPKLQNQGSMQERVRSIFSVPDQNIYYQILNSDNVAILSAMLPRVAMPHATHRNIIEFAKPLTFRYLFEHSLSTEQMLSYSTAKTAVFNNCRDILQTIYDLNPNVVIANKVELLGIAIEKNHLEIIQFLHENKLIIQLISKQQLLDLVKFDAIETLRYLLEQGILAKHPRSSYLKEQCVELDKLEILGILYKQHDYSKGEKWVTESMLLHPRISINVQQFLKEVEEKENLIFKENVKQ
ncbi:hypothetical protein PPL_08187 [Heterostelium album PN500]|uniref:Ankyrin repeat-containing protein n=1 Tax=Heterostelium pallidum (strain ATCC 26659 / Pp 5 / PN500) TaxID=670386 RepID=D3BIV2_HETP5|nr:hypothetical protein PPL_08187 [Heterostelium album PN500]EFA78726.1 hypothetical protein PPL_08187 [Heterostelium album PN500]|eukprot:XP_020430850.1 hypothetical protein PPL_08187 [Heterostelium album PN500]